MKIFLINSLYHPDTRGGAEVVTHTVARALVSRGHKVHVIALGRFDEVVHDDDGVTVHRIKPRMPINFIDLPKSNILVRLVFHMYNMFSLATSDEVMKILREQQPELVLTHNIIGMGYRLLSRISKEFKHAHTVHDVQYAYPSGLLYWHHPKESFFKKILFVMYVALMKRILSGVKYVVSPSQWLLSYYEQYGYFAHAHKKVIRNSIDLHREYVEKSYNGVYACIGQVSEHKGVKLLIEAFEIFHDKYPEVKLIIVGDGALLSELKTRYPLSWIHFAGRISNDQLPSKVFDNISYNVLASLVFENSPGTPYEGFANSTPVIVPRIGGAAELVQEGVTGFIFEPGDRESLVGALEKSYLSQNKYHWMAMQGRAFIESCSTDEYVRQILE
ncbi:glycosyltransferase [Candidatus Falkowbacteria bacterium]|nr:glycosyltransferase [Candidatus Falkowbacteria bacterium]